MWVETDGPATVEVCGARERTFEVDGHHYALVCVDGLEPGSERPYSVTLDGEKVWPPPGDAFPVPVIRTLRTGGPLLVAFGSCRVGAPHEPPYTAGRHEHPQGRELDALVALAQRLLAGGAAPQLLLLLGDQVYADDVSPGTCEFIRRRRDTSLPPGEQVADFEEYTRLYLDSWSEPTVRWLLSTVPTAMIFDDHDVHDDWNISASWVRDARAQSWWDRRIVAGFASYWLYQHLGNMTPAELAENELYARVRAVDGDAGPLLREFSFRADRESAGSRWSYRRDLGRTRVVVMDSRAGRVLGTDRRSMLDEPEWRWVEEQCDGDVDHLLLGTSLPVFLAPATHHLEGFSEALCDGAWGRLAARAGERLRRFLDLEHWAAFGESFRRLGELLHAVASGRRGPAPASVILLSGDVHHAYLASVRFRGAPAHAPVYQAVCSPLRNPLVRHERAVTRLSFTRTMAAVNGALARAAGVAPPAADWTMEGDGPWFDNQVATLRLDGRSATLRIEKAVGEAEAPELEAVLERRLA